MLYNKLINFQKYRHIERNKVQEKNSIELLKCFKYQQSNREKTIHSKCLEIILHYIMKVLSVRKVAIATTLSVSRYTTGTRTARPSWRRTSTPTSTSPPSSLMTTGTYLFYLVLFVLSMSPRMEIYSNSNHSAPITKFDNTTIFNDLKKKYLELIYSFVFFDQPTTKCAGSKTAPM